jgi:hypothetical protein
MFPTVLPDASGGPWLLLVLVRWNIMEHEHTKELEAPNVTPVGPVASEASPYFGGCDHFFESEKQKKSIYSNIFYLRYRLSIFLRSQFGVGVSDTNSKLFGPLNNLLANPRRNGMCDGGSIGSVVHHEHFQLLYIVDDNLLESVWTDISGLFIRTITDTRHRNGTLKTTTNTSINTLGFAPRGITDTHELIRLVASELLCSLLDDRLFVEWGWTSHDCN